MTTTSSPSRGQAGRLRLLPYGHLRPRAMPGGRHRDVQGSATRAAVLGAGDGLITNVSLVLGVAGASTNASAVRVAGVAVCRRCLLDGGRGLVSVRAHDQNS